MAEESKEELIFVRSLTDSDLGLFAAHRATLRSKQRAININADCAQRMLSPEIFEAKGRAMPCCVIYGDFRLESDRRICKSGKNWRLGGYKIPGQEFATLDSKDFALFRTVEHNDGSTPIQIVFLSKTRDRLKHADVGKLIELVARGSMAVYRPRSAGFEMLAAFFPDSKSKSQKKNR